MTPASTVFQSVTTSPEGVVLVASIISLIRRAILAGGISVNTVAKTAGDACTPGPGIS